MSMIVGPFLGQQSTELMVRRNRRMKAQQE